jgi:ATP-dependent DNA ligase
MRFPDWITPMAATLTERRFSGAEWLFERKFDGIRLLAFRQDGDVRLLSRNRLPQQLPAIADAIAALPVEEIILDGESTWDRGNAYHVFDVVWLNGRNLTMLPLEENVCS